MRWCSRSSPSSPQLCCKPKTKKAIKMRRLRKQNRRKNRDGGRKRIGAEVEMENLRLYLENRSIIEENERLRRAAMLLCRENRVLLFHLLANRKAAIAASEPAANKASASFSEAPFL